MLRVAVYFLYVTCADESVVVVFFDLFSSEFIITKEIIIV